MFRSLSDIFQHAVARKQSQSAAYLHLMDWRRRVLLAGFQPIVASLTNFFALSPSSIRLAQLAEALDRDADGFSLLYALLRTEQIYRHATVSELEMNAEANPLLIKEEIATEAMVLHSVQDILSSLQDHGLSNHEPSIYKGKMKK